MSALRRSHHFRLVGQHLDLGSDPIAFIFVMAIDFDAPLNPGKEMRPESGAGLGIALGNGKQRWPGCRIDIQKIVYTRCPEHDNGPGLDDTIRFEVNAVSTIIAYGYEPMRSPEQHGAVHADVLGTAVTQSPVFNLGRHWHDPLCNAKGGAI
jgi:hypothetical protein